MKGRLSYEENGIYLAECECGTALKFHTNSFDKATQFARDERWEITKSDCVGLPYAKCRVCRENKPLTLEELRGMVEKPIWLDPGKWVENGSICGLRMYACSECDCEAHTDDWDNAILSNFCPNCGTRMRSDL